MTIKKGDLVQIISGKDKGKQGKVAHVIPSTDRLAVEGLNMRKRHLKPTRTNPKGGIVEIPGTMHRSNVMIMDPHTSKPTRIKHGFTADNKKFRHGQTSTDIGHAGEPAGGDGHGGGRAGALHRWPTWRRRCRRRRARR